MIALSIPSVGPLRNEHNIEIPVSFKANVWIPRFRDDSILYPIDIISPRLIRSTNKSYLISFKHQNYPFLGQNLWIISSNDFSQHENRISSISFLSSFFVLKFNNYRRNNNDRQFHFFFQFVQFRKVEKLFLNFEKNI